MDTFTVHTGVATPILRANIDTDTIIRVEHMMAVPRGELGPYCFWTLRRRADGSENPDFVLNEPAFAGTSIIFGGENFGCGSSREQAVWALRDFGIRCIIAPSFGDIFFGNCFQNAILPVVLPADTVAALAREAEDAAGAPFTIDLERCRVTAPSGLEAGFTVEAAKRRALLLGLDDIDLTLSMANELAAFEATDRVARPWIYKP